MPPRPTLRYLRAVQDWSLLSLSSFVPNQKQLDAGISIEQQRLLKFFDIIKNMSMDGCDNVDSDRVHPGRIDDDARRSWLDEYSRKILADLLAFRERALDDECFLVNVDTEYDKKKHGIMTKEKLASSNFWSHIPPQFRGDGDIDEMFEQFKLQLSWALMGHVGSFAKRLAGKDYCSVSQRTLDDASFLMFERGLGLPEPLSFSPIPRPNVLVDTSISSESSPIGAQHFRNPVNLVQYNCAPPSLEEPALDVQDSTVIQSPGSSYSELNSARSNALGRRGTSNRTGSRRLKTLADNPDSAWTNINLFQSGSTDSFPVPSADEIEEQMWIEEQIRKEIRSKAKGKGKARARAD